MFILIISGVIEGYPPGPSSSGETVLDLSTRKKPEDTNNNIKTEQGRLEEASLRSRKYSELSDCSAASSAPPGLQENPETSSAPVCSPELGERERGETNKRASSSPAGGPEPKKPASGMLEEH